jgi:PAS domain S-box-containing protein
MKKNSETPTDASKLRRQAEAKLGECKKNTAPTPHTEVDTLRLIHELEVHQIELEMQNEELRRLQEELEASRNKYFDLFDLAPVGYLTLSETGIVLEANLTAANLLGVERSQLAQKPVNRFIVKEDQDIYYLHRKHLFETRSRQACELRMTGKGGVQLWVRIEGIAAQGNDDKLVCRATLNDITERKHDEEEIRESEKKFSTVFRRGPQMMAISDIETGRYLDVNDNFSRVTGFSKEETIGKTSVELGILTQEDRQEIVRELQSTRSISSKEIMMFRKNQQPINCLYFGEIISIFGTNRLLSLVEDITEHKRAEKELKESKMLIDAVVENVPLMIFLKESQNLRFVLFNRAGEELLGYNRKVLLGKNNLDLFPPEQAAHFMAKDREVLDGEVGMLDIPEEPIQTAKKGQRLLHTRKVCIRGADGITKYLLGISEDITERKRAEEQIRKDLREKEVMLKEIHHRVRNNLNVITSLLNLQSDRIATKEQALAAFEESKNRIYAMALVHSNLYKEDDFSRIDLTAFIKNLTQNLTQVYQTDALIDIHIEEISLDLNNAIPCGLILNELITNALKHAFPGGRKGLITIGLRVLKNDTYELAVQDDGVGLPKEIDVRKAKSLGLIIVNQLVGQIDGALEVARGKGTRFHITFPVSGERG